uniref:Uncharacterized protein n=1 Tax=Rhinolophus ferrumequinum TaxID=59479 RepID=A0A671EYB5_RHIFE
ILSLKSQRETPSLSLLASGGSHQSLAFLGLQLHHSNLLLSSHDISPILILMLIICIPSKETMVA